jgi:hypothetical protein
VHTNSFGLNIDNFDCFHFPRHVGRGGGISVYSYKLLMTSKHDVDFNAINFDFGIVMSDYYNKRLYLITVYRPPDSNVPDFLNEFSDFLSKCASSFVRDALIIISGDFNINMLKNDLLSDRFMSEMFCYNLYPTIFKATRPSISSASLIDNIFSNIPSITCSGVLLANISDHLPIFSSFLITPSNDSNAADSICDFKRMINTNKLNKLNHELEMQN